MTILAANRYRENSATQKTLGSVYTPPRAAAALVRWAVRAPSDSVLDPSCGDGVFLDATRERLRQLGNRKPQCTGVDVDAEAARSARAVCRDFFEWAPGAQQFDAVVGNPPFIRSHLFPETSRGLAFSQMRQMGLTPSRLMSTWAPFLAISCRLLNQDGRLALVIPEELLHVGYAEGLRQYLLARFRRIVVCFPNGDLFPSVQQAVVLLLCDNDPTEPSGLQTMGFREMESGPPYPTHPAPPWNWFHKWTHLFLSDNERGTVSHSFAELDWSRFSEYGRVEVGVVTGYNEFFVVSRAQAEALGGTDLCTPIVSSARDLQGIEFDGTDFRRLADDGRPCWLIDTAEPKDRLPTPLRNYLKEGEEQGINKRFKCRMREPWYAVPSVWPADALLLRQAGQVPRLVHLVKICTSTDTIHRVRWHRPAHAKRHVVGFLNTWTLIACELMGRSYGGGVLELMPGEANGIPLPPPLPSLDRVFARVDTLVRQQQLQKAIEIVDKCVTPDSITSVQYRTARRILLKLIARRKNKQNGNH